MSITAEILETAIAELKEREDALQDQINRVKSEVTPELRQVKKTIATLERQADASPAASANGNGLPKQEADPPPVTTDAHKEAVLRVLEGKRASGKGARTGLVAEEAELTEPVAKQALAELAESGDVSTNGKGVWRLAE